MAHGFAENEGRIDSRVENLCAIFWGLDAVDRSADQIHQRIGSVENISPIAKRARIPGLESPRALFFRLVARKQRDLGAKFSREIPRKVSAEKPTPPSDDNSRVGFHTIMIMEVRES